MTPPIQQRRCLAGLVLLWIGAAGAAGAGPLYPPFGIDLTAIDARTRAQDDFYQYANGAWIKRTVVDTEHPALSPGSEAPARVTERLHVLLEAAANLPTEATSADAKAGAMYAAFMDESRIEALGAMPVQQDLATIRALKDKSALAALMGRSQFDFGGSLFAAGIDVDVGEPARYVAYLGQSGLGLPDRDYYLQSDYRALQGAYASYVERLLSLVDWPQPSSCAQAIVALETRIAGASWTKSAQRDLRQLYNPLSPAELVRLAPGFDWVAYLDGARLGNHTRLVVAEYSAFPKLAAIFADTPLESLKAWQAYMLIDSAAPYLSAPFQRASYTFHHRILNGEGEMPARWQRAVTAVSGGDCASEPRDCFGTLGGAVGQLYVAHDFPPAVRARVQAISTGVVEAFRRRVQTIEWMTPRTRTEAQRKLDSIAIKIGYPEHQRDYSEIIVRRDDLVGDVRRAAAADWNFAIERSAGPVDPSDWAVTPQTISSYHGQLGDIVFTAALLQPPVYDPAADDAVNYATIGTLIAHEVSHCLDQEGRLRDASGADHDWWSDLDARAFSERTAVLGAQYASFEPLPGLHLDARLTMTENVADLAGIVVALDAYHASLRGRPAPVLGGLSGDQRFFIAYAQSWRGKATERAIRDLTETDPHSYRPFRVLGPLPNVDAWYAAFNVREHDRMYLPPGERVRIW